MNYQHKHSVGKCSSEKYSITKTDLNKKIINSSIAPAVSGLYEWSEQQLHEELRLDVDGRYPQMIASGTVNINQALIVHWIANLTLISQDTWSGIIKNQYGQAFPYTNVRIEVTRELFPGQHTAKIIFFAGGDSDRTRLFRYKSPFFHPLELEFDTEEGTVPVTTFETHSLDNRPAFLPNETLSISEIFKRAGFDVKISTGNNTVPQADTGVDKKWSYQELHDAMQVYWSHFDNKPQWAIWTFFAASESMEDGHQLGGIMFDDIGPNHRQGTAIFNNSFISDPAPSDINDSNAWTKRMRFWCAIHELGHTFNLAHSWQKHLGNPWIPPNGDLKSEPEALSFMNYPFNQAFNRNPKNFFEKFEYRFSDQELLFMRHAPEKFIQMGNSNWFEDHAFEQKKDQANSQFKLELKVNRENALFQFQEPVTGYLKLTNVSNEPQLVKEKILSDLNGMTVIIKKDEKHTQQLLPYAKYCRKLEKKIIMPGDSIYESIFLSVGKNGWLIDDPGHYTIQAIIQINGENIRSNPLKIRVTPPTGYDQEYLAQDFFSDDVGRILAFDGSRFLKSGNNILHEVTEKLSDRAVSLHAHIALARPLSYNYKIMNFERKAEDLSSQITILPAQPEEARNHFAAALTERQQLAAQTLSHVDYKEYMESYSNFLSNLGEDKEAARIQSVLYHTLSERNVLDRVLHDIKNRQAYYEEKL
ncbi:hypothetical protein D0808_15535 [Bacillus subtilis]|uniref:hypothetical protein n=1 Tax=Bacillus subtilis TaxID=1423 RepID=UPI001292D543|nr:hypothetical protein [Bacillus subtilis]QFY82710.1 hypothetical protein D0808_15535 [Bacillus subtilis]